MNMINQSHSLSVRRQCSLLSLSRGRVYREATPETERNEAIMLEIDKIMVDAPASGSRTIAERLSLDFGVPLNRKRVRRLMKAMGVKAVYPRRSLSSLGEAAYVYPYLLKGLDIVRPNQVWCADITYIPMRGGHMYLVAVMDWFSRKILSWRLSNTIDTSFCLEALEAAVVATGTTPEIFNTDQGSQFTSNDWTEKLTELGVQISMDGKGRWIDNVVIERFWGSLKREDLHLNLYDSAVDLEKGIESYITRYNEWRPHSALGRRITPEMAYSGKLAPLSRLGKRVG